MDTTITNIIVTDKAGDSVVTIIQNCVALDWTFSVITLEIFAKFNKQLTKIEMLGTRLLLQERFELILLDENSQKWP